MTYKLAKQLKEFITFLIWYIPLYLIWNIYELIKSLWNFCGEYKEKKTL